MDQTTAISLSTHKLSCRQKNKHFLLLYYCIQSILEQPPCKLVMAGYWFVFVIGGGGNMSGEFPLCNDVAQQYKYRSTNFFLYRFLHIYVFNVSGNT